jgi:bifunctional DNA-binding transcriptional regulator/antitoxin component of YhaV-PrlF toxin-antitoxin module
MKRKFLLRVSEYGTSTVIILPRDVRDFTGIKEGDFLQLIANEKDAFFGVQRMRLVPLKEENQEGESDNS